MIIEYRASYLKKCYASNALAVRRWGASVARRYAQRINILHACESVDDLLKIPQLKFHALKGSRQKQYAIQLDGFMRLIVSFEEESREVIKIEEVSKHYDD